MASTTFTNGVTLTDADWFNDVNRLHYTIFSDPADAAAAATAIGLGTASTPTFAGITTTGNLTLSGTAANIVLGANYISRAGTDAGISLDASNNATVSGNLTVSGGTVSTASSTALSLTTSAEQVRITDTASANRYVTITGSNGGSPAISTSAGNLSIGTSVDITGGLSTTTAIGVDSGGTGQTTLTANNVLLGNGTSAVQFVAPARQAMFLRPTVQLGWFCPASSSGITLGTEQATTSGTAIDFTGLPSGVKRFTLMLSGVSTSGSSSVIMQLGDSGGVENTGYTSAASTGAAGTTSSSTAGFLISNSHAGDRVLNGWITAVREDGSDNTWVVSSVMVTSGVIYSCMSCGVKALSAELDRVRLTTAGGTDTFDAGAMNICYEF